MGLTHITVRKRNKLEIMKLSRLVALSLCCILALGACKKQAGNKRYDKKEEKKEEPTPSGTASVTVMSFNIRHTGEASDTGDKAWDKRKSAVVAAIKDQDPDLIGFQECTNEQANYLAAELNAYGFYLPGNNKCIAWKKAKMGEHASQQGFYYVTDKAPISKPSAGWDGDTRATAWVKVTEKTTSIPVFFFCTHLSVSGRTARIEGAKLNVDQMKMIAGSNSTQFIVGDMNTNEDACHDNFKTYLSDARALSPETDYKGTYNGWKPSSTSIIDYIYYKNISSPLKYATVTNENYGVTFVSDHYPIIFKCEIKAAE